MRSSGCWLQKVVVGAITTVVFLWLLLVGIMGSTTTGEAKTKPIFKHEMVMFKDKLVYNPKLNHNYMMSKRRVPNGPDPIHNRRAGNSKRPPGQA